MKTTVLLPVTVEFVWDPGELSSSEYPGYPAQASIDLVRFNGRLVPFDWLSEENVTDIKTKCEEEHTQRMGAARDRDTNERILAKKEDGNAR